jgi:hypothetical protein
MPIKKSVKMSAKRLERFRRLAKRRFRDRNRRFKKLSVNEQRLKIIQDVIAHLESEKLKATKDTYLKILGVRKAEEGQQLHEIIEQSKCRVCGIGGVFSATVLLNNDFKVKSLHNNRTITINGEMDLVNSNFDDRSMRRYLKEWFTGTQLDLIEAAFESNPNYATNATSDTELSNAVKFGRQFRDSKSRLIAICENILANNGKFVPTKTARSAVAMSKRR